MRGRVPRPPRFFQPRFCIGPLLPLPAIARPGEREKTKKSMNHDDLMASFVAVTGAPEAQALQMLESTGFDLEQAVGLFFAVGEAGGAPAPAAAPSAAAHEDDEALARRLQQ